ncbi:MAG: UDP-3-O-acyl-N-acetylglucosamine deacetylase [Desulfobacteraceae bacterium]|nr:UDP-3-O-acyl-N-acetylglucosamine deacetylase [Desulfobacteraceae bacterium]MCF8093935.1 UDP-3-O-acyl-N-acetylglucosamine deacetylase [Desulfobacteraceae bacterium]
MGLYKRQRTLAAPASFAGRGLHSGKTVELTVHPAAPNFGIRFKRVDLPAKPMVAGHFNRVVDTSLATVIGENGCIVSTIEHLMAALAGLSIDNALVEIDDYELPIMDGSAAMFTRTIREKGIVEQDAPRFYFVIREPIILENGDKSVCLYPDNRRIISCIIEFDHPIIGRQSYEFELDDEQFETEISGARTFGFMQELELLKFYGLAKGGSLENAVAIDENGVINEEGLRWPDEFVRHKTLDCIGDFSLLGMPILGRIVLYKSGHNFNHEFLKTFFKKKKCWQTATIETMDAAAVCR